MKEQLPTAKARSLETPKKLIKAALKNPLTYGAIGISIIASGFVDISITPNKIDRQLDEAFPLTASRDVVEEAQREVLVFDRQFRERVISGQTNIDITEFSQQPQIAQEITIVNQQEQKDNLKKQLDSQATVRQLSKVVGGLIVVIGAAVGPSLRPLLKREDNEENEARPERIANV